jgi:hypothetical protein
VSMGCLLGGIGSMPIFYFFLHGVFGGGVCSPVVAVGVRVCVARWGACVGCLRGCVWWGAWAHTGGQGWS